MKAEEQKSRKAEEQKSRRAEKQKSRKAEKQKRRKFLWSYGLQERICVNLFYLCHLCAKKTLTF